MGSIHDGHRQRAKAEFLARGLSGMADHKVLELLLFYGIPRGDVNALAHTMIQRFGSLAGVFNAPYEQLVKVNGIGDNAATLIRLLPAVAARYLEDSARPDGIMENTWKFQELLMPLFFGAQNEMAYLVCMDGKNKLIACRLLGEGITDSVVITARRVLEEALACNASRVALAHNHRSGVAIYSPADLAATRELSRLLRQVNIELVDHFVIAHDDMVSMRESGALEEIWNKD